MVATTTPPSRHTARAERTRRAIVDAAAQRFSSVGYSQASMDEIATAAGVTKPTVYAHFGSKEQLFTALLQSAMGELTEMPLPEATTRDDVERALVDHATARVDSMLAATALGLFKAASAEGIRRPEWAQALIESLGTSQFELWLGSVADSGLLDIESTTEAVELFWALIDGALFFPVVIGIAPVPTAAERQRVIDRSVRTFLAAFATGGDGGSNSGTRSRP